MRGQKEERKEFGSFYYRYPSGESPADVFDRVSSFMESLHRMWKEHPNRADNYVLVIHGMTIQCFLMRWLKYSVDDFNSYQNFTNCEFAVLEKNGDGKFKIDKVAHNCCTVKECVYIGPVYHVCVSNFTLR
jgi:broad specificity phosphatase PhoE